jgi:hypothetical protein
MAKEGHARKATEIPLALCLRLLAIAYGMNEPPRGEKVRINLTRPPTNAGDFHWLLEQAGRIAGKLDAVHEGREELDEETRRWLVEFFGRRHIPARDPDQAGGPLFDREAQTGPGPLDALIAAETVRDLLGILSPRERQLLLQVASTESPAEEVAAAIAPTPGAARELLSRTRKKIRSRLEI